MNELQIFNNPEFGEIRTLEEGGKVLFCASDVAKALGYSRPNDAVASHCRSTVKRRIPHPQSPDKTIEMTFIPESDIYRLSFGSKLPTAERLTDWIVEEVIPTIRKTGGYSQKALSPVEMFSLQAQINMEQERRLKALEQKQAVVEDVMDVMAAPMLAEDGWQEKAQKAINMAVERYQKNHQTFRAELYEEVEQRCHVDLSTRQTRLRKRMKENGATVTECKNVSKLHVIARDPKLRTAFEAVLKAKVIRLAQEHGAGT